MNKVYFLKYQNTMNKKLLGLFFASLLIFAFGSCKPKQSAYKSVYESAKEKEMDQTEDVSYQPVSRPSVVPSTSGENTSVRKERVTPVYDSDASGLKAYSVVIAAMGMKPNADALKARMVNAGYNPILVKNEQGMFRVIISSFDTKEEAANSRSQILADFFKQGTAESLKAKYGIPFNDWWILQREY